MNLHLIVAAICCLCTIYSSMPCPVAHSSASASNVLPVAGNRCPISGLLTAQGASNSVSKTAEVADSAGAPAGGSKCPFSGLFRGSGSRAQATQAPDTAPSHGAEAESSEAGVPDTLAGAERKGEAAVCPMGFGGGTSDALSALHCARQVRCLWPSCKPVWRKQSEK